MTIKTNGKNLLIIHHLLFTTIKVIIFCKQVKCCKSSLRIDFWSSTPNCNNKSQSFD